MLHSDLTFKFQRLDIQYSNPKNVPRIHDGESAKHFVEATN